MHAAANGADSAPVGNTGRAAKIQSRLDGLGISDREFAERTGVDRKALRRAANGEAVRGSTYVAIETWLTRLERETGDVEVEELPEGFEYIGDPRQRFISFEVPDARIVVKGPIEDADLLREQAERIAERARRQRDKLKEIATDET